MSKRLCIAKIASAHGIKGLVKLHVFVENVELLNRALFIDEISDKTFVLKLKNATAKHWLAEIEGIKDRNEAEKLRGINLYINEDDLPAPDEDEIYINDLIGMPCINEDGGIIGKAIGFENFGAGDLLEIQPEGSESFYLPFNDDTILKIEDDKIIVSIPEGLRE
jgi:16S rRNA processing protein RimM